MDIKSVYCVPEMKKALNNNRLIKYLLGLNWTSIKGQ